ncbi:hypothetical protein LTR53_004172 [Teratosphaeriaceae sp. CCFEE 6253]|nr:hypothetical protein LTR53_004172 [Teratosphaeriaceae sp. CCFEE 6253]
MTASPVGDNQGPHASQLHPSMHKAGSTPLAADSEPNGEIGWPASTKANRMLLLARDAEQLGLRALGGQERGGGTSFVRARASYPRPKPVTARDATNISLAPPKQARLQRPTMQLAAGLTLALRPPHPPAAVGASGAVSRWMACSGATMRGLPFAPSI